MGHSDQHPERKALDADCIAESKEGGTDELEDMPPGTPQRIRAFGEVLNRLMELMHKIPSIRVPQQEEFMSKLQELRRTVPVVVVAGSQSHGKSTVLNRLFKFKGGECELPTGQGMVTKCPTEFRGRTTATEAKFSVVRPGSAEEFFPTFAKIQEQMQAATDLTFDRLVVEFPFDQDVTIVDLPGCTVRPGYPSDFRSDYMAQIRQLYLESPHAIRLVVSMAGDEQNNAAREWLTGLDDVIQVVTRTDLDDEVTRNACLVQLHRGKTAMVNICEDEVARVTALGHNDHPNAIVGTAALRDYVQQRLEVKVDQLMPAIVDNMTQLQGMLDKQLQKIGRTEPDHTDMAYKARRHLERQIEQEFLREGTEYAKQRNELKLLASPAAFEAFADEITPLEELSAALRAGARHIPGSNGWYHLAEEDVNRITDEILPMMERMACQFLEVAISAAKGILRTPYNEYTKAIQQKLTGDMAELQLELQDLMLEELRKKVDARSKAMHVSGSSDHMGGIAIDQVRKLLEVGVRLGRLEAVDATAIRLMTDPDFAADNGVQVADAAAHAAHAWLVKFFKEGETAYSDTLNELGEKYGDLVRERVRSSVDRSIRKDSLNDAPEMTERRTQLIALEKTMQALIAVAR